MKNITITLRDDIADWLRVEAAKADRSMSAFVAEMLEARMGRGADQLAALEHFLGSECWCRRQPAFAGRAV
jgi:plasmid stability protein